MLRGEPALVDSTSPRWGEKASYSSAVCLGTSELEVMELEGNSRAATRVAVWQQVRAHHPEPLIPNPSSSLCISVKVGCPADGHGG